MIRLTSCMKEEALDHLVNEPYEVRNDFWLLVKSMERRFGDRMLPVTYQKIFDQGLKKEPKEDLDQFAARVKKYMGKAYPQTAKSREGNIRMVDVFLKGLDGREVPGLDKIRYDISHYGPFPLAEVVEKVRINMADQEDISSRKTSIRRVEIEDSDDSDEQGEDSVSLRRVHGKDAVTEDRLKQFAFDLQNQLVKTLQSELNPKSNNWRKNIECHGCGKKGHFVRECLQKNVRKDSDRHHGSTADDDAEDSDA